MRKLSPELKSFFDAKNIAGDDATPTELLMLTAFSCVGLTETSDNHGMAVELFQSSVGRPQGQAWCVDFLQACIAYVEAAKKVRSPLVATESSLVLWETHRDDAEISALPGDILVWRRDAVSGHVGLIVDQDSLCYYTVEGNTSDSAHIDRNGDGVYAKKRAKGGSKTFKELGFLRVFPS